MYFPEQLENESAEKKFLETCDVTKVNFCFFFSIDTQKWNLSPYHIYINGPYTKKNNTL